MTGSVNNSLVYDTNTLIQVIPNLMVAQNFLLDKFFTGSFVADTEEVSIDVDIGKRRMSPFVSPLVEGRLVEQRRYQTNTFRPPYIKDKRAPDLRKPVRRMIGERIGGSFDGAEREQANLNFEMTDQVDMLNRRLEWMAASALASGTITVSGDGFPTSVIDFGRDSSLTVGLTSTATWTATNITNGTATPAANIEDWQQAILKLSGAKVTDIVFSVGAFKRFILDPELKGAIYYPSLAQSGNVINPGAQIEQGAVYKGKWGQYDLWVYNDWYVDDNNVQQPMMADGSLFMSGPNLMGTRAFGMIQDPEFNYRGMAYAPKTWVEKDPAQRIILMQAAPLVIPGRPNASFCAQVF